MRRRTQEKLEPRRAPAIRRRYPALCVTSKAVNCVFLKASGAIFVCLLFQSSLDSIPFVEYNINMWEVEYTDVFEEWWETLSEAEQNRVAFSVNLLRQTGPSLPFPHSTRVGQSRHGSCGN